MLTPWFLSVILEAAPITSQVNGSHFDETNHRNGSNISNPEADRSLVYVVSAKDSIALQGMNKNLADHIRKSISNDTQPSPTDLAFTLAERKSLFPWVTAVRARSLEELANRLNEPELKAIRSTRKPRLGFVFNGQGAQWHAMGRELIDAYPVFGSAILKADGILKGYGATWSLYGKFTILLPLKIQ
jgi:acyl transferase domain-containing protein